MGHAFITRRGLLESLNFSVYHGINPPEIAQENMIWLQTGAQVPEWGISETNPYMSNKDIDLSDGLTIKEGYFVSGGSISTSSNSTNLAVYGEEYIPVEYGRSYNYTYSLSSAKSQWLVICEYKSDGTFVQRYVAVNSVTGAFVSGTYTPSNIRVSSVRLSWRTFGDEACSLQFIEQNAEYTLEHTPDNAVWISTRNNGNIQFSAINNNILIVKPYYSFVYSSGVWEYVKTFVYQSNEWRPTILNMYVYNSGDTCEEISGGWDKSSGTITYADSEIKIIAGSSSGSAVYTNNMIDLTPYSTIRFCMIASSPSATTIAGVSKVSGVGDYDVSYSIPNSTTEYTTFDIDISELYGDYYVKFQTNATSVGCSVQYIQLIA